MHAPTGAPQPITQPLKLQQSIQKDQQHQIILTKESHAGRIDHLKPSTIETNNSQTNNPMKMKYIHTHYHMTFQNMTADHNNVSIHQRPRKSITNHKKQQTIAKTLPSNQAEENPTTSPTIKKHGQPLPTSFKNKMISFMKMQDCVKHNFEFAKNKINPLAS